MMNMALGVFYANSIFVTPVEKEFGWSRGEVSLISTFGIVMIASWFVVGGRLNDRKGPRVVAFIGGVLFSLGFLLAAYASLVGWYLSWALIGNDSLRRTVGRFQMVPDAAHHRADGRWTADRLFVPIAPWLIQHFAARMLQILPACSRDDDTCLLKNPPTASAGGWNASTVRSQLSAANSEARR